MTPEERLDEIERTIDRSPGMALQRVLTSDLDWLCKYTKGLETAAKAGQVEMTEWLTAARRGGAEAALLGMRDWCAKQEESATEEMRLADSRGWYKAEGEFEDFRKAYQKVREHIEQRLASLKEDKADG